MDTSGYFIPSSQPDGSEIAAEIVTLFSISILSMFFGMKTYNVHFKYLTYSRWLILALYVFSWAFTTSSLVLVTTNNGRLYFLHALLHALTIITMKETILPAFYLLWFATYSILVPKLLFMLGKIACKNRKKKVF